MKKKAEKKKAPVIKVRTKTSSVYRGCFRYSITIDGKKYPVKHGFHYLARTDEDAKKLAMKDAGLKTEEPEEG